MNSRQSKNHLKEPKDIPKPEADVMRDMDVTLRRMLNSPPKPHKQKVDSSASQASRKPEKLGKRPKGN